MDELMQALTQTGYQFAAWAWDKAPTGDYGVVSLDNGADFVADGHHAERGTNGFVDYFTRVSSPVPRNTIEQALDGVCGFSLRSVQFEDDTGYIHYEWTVSLFG